MKPANDDQRVGIEIVRKALQAPARQIAENAGVDGAVVVGKLLESNDANWGFDAQADEYGDLVARGIIDPTKVVRTALQDAASVAGLLITTEAMVAEKPEKESPMPAGGPAAAWAAWATWTSDPTQPDGGSKEGPRATAAPSFVRPRGRRAARPRSRRRRCRAAGGRTGRGRCRGRWRTGRRSPARARPRSAGVDQRFQRAGLGVEADDVAVAQPRQRAAVGRLGRQMDRGRHLARGAGHAAVGDQRHLEALVLQHAQRRRQLVQLGHAVGLRALEADHGDEVAVQLAAP